MASGLLISFFECFRPGRHDAARVSELHDQAARTARKTGPGLELSLTQPPTSHDITQLAAAAKLAPGHAADRAVDLALVPITQGRLPDDCDAWLAEPGDGDVFATRLWYDTLIAHAVPPTAQPLLARFGQGAGLLPLLRQGGRLQSMTSPYTLEWRPLLAPGMANAAGNALGGWLRHRPPLRFEAMIADLDTFLSAAASRGIVAQHYAHFGNWHEELCQGADWESYLAARPPALRTTVQRKLARARRDFRFELIDGPAALPPAISAYEAVRAESWKPAEPFPDFDAALLRAAAPHGLVRLGILRDAVDGRPVAAQYWLVSGRKAWLLKLCHSEARRAASPGTALTAMMIRHLLQHDAASTLDFGRGDDVYKKLWVGARRQRNGVVLAHPWHPAGLLSVSRHRLGGWLRRARTYAPDGLATEPAKLGEPG